VRGQGGCSSAWDADAEADADAEVGRVGARSGRALLAGARAAVVAAVDVSCVLHAHACVPHTYNSAAIRGRAAIPV
jgi:hypothetical protein